MVTAIFWVSLSLIPIGISLWALLDCARRPPWAWSLARRSQVAWLGAIAFGVLLMFVGLAISLYYLIRVRPQIAAVEAGDFGRFEPAPESDG